MLRTRSQEQLSFEFPPWPDPLIEELDAVFPKGPQSEQEIYEYFCKLFPAG